LTRGPRTGRRTSKTANGRERVGVRELRQNLSVHLRRVTDGAVLEVTDRGRPVAMLAPLPEAATPLQRLILEGRVVQVATRNLADLGPPLKIALRIPLSKVLEELREDRI
jgi:prevent-host-death family protein